MQSTAALTTEAKCLKDFSEAYHSKPGDLMLFPIIKHKLRQ
jgi:hypothetical protein